MKTPRAYDVLLRAYPRRVRDRLGADMRETFALEYDRVRSQSLPVRGWFWVVTVIQALWFGLVERILRGGSMRSFLAVDWRSAYRALVAAPVVTTAAVLSLALGIGANTALFSILNSLLFKQMPADEPERLVLLDRDSITNPIWEEVRSRERQLADGVFAWSTETFDLSAGGATEPITGAWATGGMFRVLGLRTTLGRPLTDSDDDRRAGTAAAVAVVTHSFWQRHFGGAPDVIGRTLMLERVPFTVVGVIAPGFYGLDIGTDLNVVVPLAAEALMRGPESKLDSRTSWFLHTMARLRPGQSIDDATAAIRSVRPQIREATIPPRWSAKDQAGYLTEPIGWVSAVRGRSPMRGRYRDPLIAVLAVVGTVLLIACANIANLLLARATARRHEMSVRLALGASRARLARQLLAESVFLASLGALGGLLIASWGGRLLVDQLSTWSDVVFLDLSLDWRVLAFTSGVACVTAMLFGSAAAFSVARIAPHDALKEQGRAIAGERRVGVRQALVVVQVALSMALVVGAGLFVRTFASLARAPLGFDPRPLLVTEIEMPPDVSDPAARMALFNRFRDAAAAVPGVSSVAMSLLSPISDGGWNAYVDVPDGPSASGRQRLHWVNAIAPGWIATYGMHLRAGRDFDERDRAGQPPAMIVNESFVQRRLGAGVVAVGAVGRTVVGEVEGPSTKRSYEIVGVVSDAVYESPRRGVEPTMYVPLTQLTEQLQSSILLTVKARAPSVPLRRVLAGELRRVDSSGAISFRSFADQLGATMTQERLIAMVAGVFGVLALVMVSLGLAGVTSYWVSRRRAEIGIRMALGAPAAGVVRMVLGQIAWLLAIGIAAGLALSFWASGFVGTLLFQLGPRDPVTFAGAALLLVVVGLLAGWVPARRAARLDPLSVLREG